MMQKLSFNYQVRQHFMMITAPLNMTNLQNMLWLWYPYDKFIINSESHVLTLYIPSYFGEFRDAVKVSNHVSLLIYFNLKVHFFGVKISFLHTRTLLISISHIFIVFKEEMTRQKKDEVNVLSEGKITGNTCVLHNTNFLRPAVFPPFSFLFWSVTYVTICVQRSSEVSQIPLFLIFYILI